MADQKRLAFSIIQFLHTQLQSGSMSPDAQESLEGLKPHEQPPSTAAVSQIPLFLIPCWSLWGLALPGWEQEGIGARNVEWGGMGSMGSMGWDWDGIHGMGWDPWDGMGFMGWDQWDGINGMGWDGIHGIVEMDGMGSMGWDGIHGIHGMGSMG
ncbi:hypothetical protein TURU_028785 [Turdus rufiventris]|nr:hypothetical protein TURU_028785 [Turdus rufiventris]